MRCQLSLAKKKKKSDQLNKNSLFELDLKIIKKNEFRRKIMNISKKLQLAKKSPKSEHFFENIFNL